ncbi:glutathione synthase [Crinalium epipsammum PCC 9333]|uniref:Glutathione synthetase n=1 Tax=Crinalium epipsammum PCC 9333 TaxID=1173022 RepID=K9VZL4_9CYAN|nr:glutathione synthase [Crinalium epipsammum]AFZ13426.1 glutathione synthase [Crinalium epipsammum PCC 9333]
MKIAFIIDPIQRLDPTHDTSVALIEAAQALGHEVWITQAQMLSVVKSQAWAILERVELTPVQLLEGRWVASENWYKLGDRVLLPLEEMDAVFMRKDPPVTVPYLYTTYILDYINPEKTLVVNSPAGLRAANEKMYALQFTEAIPETIVSQDKEIIREFVEKKGAAILKPLGNKAGEGILYLEASDRNFNSIIEISTQWGQVPVMIQTYLPEAKDGDKRIILLNGEPIGTVNRIPTGNEFRGNMAVGGRVAQTEITEREHQMCVQMAAKLQQDGLYFVGIDVIGGYLTEVNVTSPTGIREIDRLSGANLGKQVMEWLGQRMG